MSVLHGKGYFSHALDLYENRLAFRSVCSVTDKNVLDQWSSQEQENEERERRDELRAQYETEANPKRRIFHKFIVFLSAVAVCSSLFMGLGQLIGTMYQEQGPIQYVLRLYVVMFCLLAALVELEWTKFARESAVLRFWVTRGLFYCFIGLLGLEENDTLADKTESLRNFDAAREFTRVVAFMIIGVGTTYAAMGIFCLQLYYNRLRSNYESRLGRAEVVREATGPFIDSENSTV